MKKYCLLVLLFSLSFSCTEKKGTFEKAGEKIDEGIQKSQDKVNEGLEKTENRLHEHLDKPETKPSLHIEGHL